MNFHPVGSYDAAFKAELDHISANISADLGRITTLPAQKAEQLLEAILARGCQAQNIRNIVLGREAAKEIPRDWLVARVEATAKRVLNLEDEWEYQRLLELYSDIDAGLVSRLVARGLASGNAEVREAAEDFREHTMDTYGYQLSRIVTLFQQSGFSASVRGEGAARFVYAEHSARAVEVSHDGVGFFTELFEQPGRFQSATISRIPLNRPPSRLSNGLNITQYLSRPLACDSLFRLAAKHLLPSAWLLGALSPLR